MNLNTNIGKHDNYKFFELLFTQKNILEEYIYIFGSKNSLSTEKLLEILIDIYNKGTRRFLYLDFEYINNLRYRKDLKEYFSFWFIRPFIQDYEKYKTFFSDIIKSIDFGNIGYLIKKLIEFIKNNYQGEKLFIILNNVNEEKSYNYIDDIKKSTVGEGCNHYFIIFCNIENKYNFDKFCEIYTNDKGRRLILIPDLIFNEPIDNAKKEINDLFFEYNVNKFVDLIKIFNFSSFMSYKSEKNENDFFEIDLMKKYIKFFGIIVEHNFNDNKPIIKDIKFKNKQIKEIFFTQYQN